MPLTTGKQSVRSNMKELLTGKVGKSRRKAISTLAKKRGISKEQARIIQARAIALSQAKKRS